MQTQTVAAGTGAPTRPTIAFTPLPTLVPGEIAKVFVGPHLLSVLLDDKRLVDVPAVETWFIAVNHRGFGANADLHLDRRSQLQLQGVTDARVQVRLLEGSRIFAQSGPYPNGAEIEFAGLPVIATTRGCLGTEYTDQTTLTVLCFQGACLLSTDFGATAEEIAAGQSVTIDVSRLLTNPARPIIAANASAYWDLLQRTAAGQDDARQCNVPAPPSLPSPTTRPERGPGPAPANTPVPPTPTLRPSTTTYASPYAATYAQPPTDRATAAPDAPDPCIPTPPRTARDTSTVAKLLIAGACTGAIVAPLRTYAPQLRRRFARMPQPARGGVAIFSCGTRSNAPEANRVDPLPTAAGRGTNK